MTDVHFEKADTLPTEGQLKSLEEKIGYGFPKDYREFLLTTNGGRPTEYHLVRIEDCNDDVLIHVFLGTEPPTSIWDTIQNLDDELPEGFIVIANDPGGNKFLMDLSEGEPTTIYYWDRVRHFRRSTKKANTYEIAGTFTEFLGMLRLMPN